MTDMTAFARFRDSDIWWSFRRSPITVGGWLSLRGADRP